MQRDRSDALRCDDDPIPELGSHALRVDVRSAGYETDPEAAFRCELLRLSAREPDEVRLIREPGRMRGAA